MTLSPLKIPVQLLIPFVLFVFVTVGALESPTVRVLPYVVLTTISLFHLRLIAYLLYIVLHPTLLDL